MAARWRTAVEAGMAAAAVAVLRSALVRREEMQRNRGLARGRKILILGAGFGGMGVAQELARLLPEDGNGEITLVDADNYLLFTPMLTEAAGGDLDTQHIISPARKLHKRVRFVQGRVTSIDPVSKTATVRVGKAHLKPEERTLHADFLVIALGSVTNYHGIPGVEKTALGMKNLSDAGAVCSRVLACLERANEETDAAARRELLTFVVGGGGFTGVETMAALNGMLRERVHEYKGFSPGDIRTVIVHPGERLLPEITPELAKYAEQKLKQRGIEILLNARIAEAGDNFVQVEGGERIATKTLVWAAGVAPSPVIEAMDAPKGKHHGLRVEPTCELSEHAGVWSLGDCAEVPQPDGKGTYAPTAQNATREGNLVARNILASLRGEPQTPFRYNPMGELALVGRHSGVGRVYGQNFSGRVAWAMWRAVYLAKMPSAAQRARILGDWTLDLLFGREPVPVTVSSQDQEGKSARRRAQESGTGNQAKSVA